MEFSTTTCDRHGVESRAALARERVKIAHEMLKECRFCAHNCGVNRLSGKLGRCRAGDQPRCFSAQVELSDELELIPTFAIALGGCDLRCSFCITGANSWNADGGELFEPDAMARRAVAALEKGARTVMLLGGEPTIHLPAVMEFVAAMPDTVRLVWKTNGHGSATAREMLAGLFDVWLADYKFGNDACAERLAGISGYGMVVKQNLRWAYQDTELIVRHLVMPGHLECCWKPVAEWLATELPGVKVNLRTGFWPAWRSARHAELVRGLAAADALRAEEIAKSFRLKLVQ